MTIHEDAPWPTGALSSIVDNEQHSALDLEECFDEGSTVDISSKSHEATLLQSSIPESQHLVGQLRVREDMIVAAMRHIDDTQALVAEYCWRATMTQGGPDGEFSLEDF